MSCKSSLCFGLTHPRVRPLRGAATFSARARTRFRAARCTLGWTTVALGLRTRCPVLIPFCMARCAPGGRARGRRAARVSRAARVPHAVAGTPDFPKALAKRQSGPPRALASALTRGWAWRAASHARPPRRAHAAAPPVPRWRPASGEKAVMPSLGRFSGRDCQPKPADPSRHSSPPRRTSCCALLATTRRAACLTVRGPPCHTVRHPLRPALTPHAPRSAAFRRQAWRTAG